MRATRMPFPDHGLKRLAKIPRGGGRWPVQSYTIMLRRKHPVRCLVLLFTATLASGGACADDAAEPAGATEAARLGLLQASVTATPALAAARARVDAARERTGAAGRLADPEVELMGSRADMVDEDRTMWELNVRQSLPKRGERGADRERAAAAVAMAEADYALMAGEMAMDLAMAASEIEAAGQRIALLEKQIGRLEAILGSVDARLAAGTGKLADRLAVQTQVASMQLMVEQERRMADDARTEMRARLGSLAGESLPVFAAPPLESLSAAESAAVRLATAREAEAAAMKSMAQAGGRPMTGVGLRLEREQTRMGNEDTVGLAFMTEIPWRARRYARAEERAALAESVAARADATSARLRVDAALARVERAARLAATARQLSAETRARLEAEFEALLRAAAAAGGTGAMSGDSTVFMTVEILDKVTTAELQAIDAEAQERIARAGLWPHVSASFWTITSENQPTTPTP